MAPRTIATALAVFFALILPALAQSSPTPPTGPTIQVGQPSHVQTVPFKKHNKLLKKRAVLTGHKQKLRHSPVSLQSYKRLKRSIKSLRRKCKAAAPLTGASYYGGPSDHSTTGDSGAYGHLTGTLGFAELGMGHALGTITPRSSIFIHYGARTVKSPKLDIGRGGDSVGGYPRTIDLWYQTKDALGFGSTGVVQWSKRNCWV